MRDEGKVWKRQRGTTGMDCKMCALHDKNQRQVSPGVHTVSEHIRAPLNHGMTFSELSFTPAMDLVMAKFLRCSLACNMSLLPLNSFACNRTLLPLC